MCHVSLRRKACPAGIGGSSSDEQRQGTALAFHLFCYVLENRLPTLGTHVGELDSVPLVVSPDHSTDRVNGYTRNG
jgi:hypothetical protein